MPVNTIQSNELSVFSPENIRNAIGSVIEAIQKTSTINDTNLILDAQLSRSLTIAQYVFGENGLDKKYHAIEILSLTNQALSKLGSVDDANCFRVEITNQFEALRNHFCSIKNHPFNLALSKNTYENNIYGLALFLAESNFSMSGSVIDAFNVFNSQDLEHWLITPISDVETQSNVFLAALLDVLSHYSYNEFKNALRV